MKVGYVAPMSIAAVNGGVRTQAMFTIRHIKQFGVEPVLISPWGDDDLHRLDLVHVFGASTENEGIMEQLTTQGVPVALSPIFYSNRGASAVKTSIKAERMLSIFGSGIRSGFTVKARLCKLAGIILPNTTEEARLIEKGFSISPTKLSVVPNGVEERFAEADPALFREKYGLKDFVLFAGQAGAPRKNVVLLLEAAQQVKEPVVIIGTFGNDKYGKRCIQLAQNSANITLVETLPHDSELLASAYAACKVFVLPSQYETPGIAAMEAALAGAEIVITELGGTKDYFLKFAEYINPKSSDSLLQGIQHALVKKPSDQLKQHILEHYTWQKVAEQTAQNYKKLLG